ncbi:hypothetical protein EDB86DRAFT_2960780, partial [Lactarius hatsudake]
TCVHALLSSPLMVFIVLLFAMQVMSLPTFQNITDDSLNGHHLIIGIAESFIFGAHLTFVQAVIVIFKHATFLRLKGLSSESSLTQAELDYREANTDLIIQEHLTGSSQDSVELSASFIMATDIGSFTLASVKLISSCP